MDRNAAAVRHAARSFWQIAPQGTAWGRVIFDPATGSACVREPAWDNSLKRQKRVDAKDLLDAIRRRNDRQFQSYTWHTGLGKELSDRVPEQDNQSEYAKQRTQRHMQTIDTGHYYTERVLLVAANTTACIDCEPAQRPAKQDNGPPDHYEKQSKQPPREGLLTFQPQVTRVQHKHQTD